MFGITRGSIRDGKGRRMERNEDECKAMIKSELYRSKRYAGLSKREKEKVRKRVNVIKCTKEPERITEFIDAAVKKL